MVTFALSLIIEL